MRAILALGAAALPACGDEPSAARPQALFCEGAAQAGLDFRHASGARGEFLFPEIMGGGVALADFDGDGRLDVLCVQSGALEGPHGGHRLFRNLGGRRFEDVSARAGIPARGYGMGAAAADHDRDGDVDLFLTCVGPDLLLENQGDGTFTDISASAGVAGNGWSASAGFADVDGDGLLDLYVSSYLRWSAERELVCTAGDGERDYCPPTHYAAPAPDLLFRNLGGGRFEDVSERMGLRAAPHANGLGVAFGDLDLDGALDIAVANDMHPNHVWLRRGAGFAEEALPRGAAYSAQGAAESGMGIAAADLDEDGDLDLLLTHMRHQKATLYRNNAGSFEDISARAGLTLLTRPYTGFGLLLQDFDNDSRLDAYIANGRVTREPPFADARDPYAEENLLLSPGQGLRFVERLPRGGVSPPLVATSRGAAAGDLDDDGRVDVVVINRDAPAHLLWNEGAGGAWIGLRVLEPWGSDALGAVVEVRAGERVQTRRVDPASGYCSSQDPRVHFGLGAHAGPVEVSVRWPGGARPGPVRLETGRWHTLRRPEK